MRYNTIGRFASALGVAMALPALAHHGISAKFDTTSGLSLSGRVAYVDWANPHAHIFMIVEKGDEVERWYVELESPLLLKRSGWSADTLNPGDMIEVQGHPARDGSSQVWGNSVMADGGQVFSVNTQGPVESELDGLPTPRWPDGQPRLGPPPGESGYWVPLKTGMVEVGLDIEMESNGLLRNIADASRVAPMQEWALRLYERRQRQFLSFDPSFTDCKPPSGPRKYQVPFGFQLLEDRPLERIFFIQGGGNHDWHLIYTDGRALDGGFELDDGNLLYYGRASAGWEGDTLVVESEGFNEKWWLSGGLPHTDLLRLHERITRPDFDTLTYEVTVNDPGAYTRPWTASWTMQWVSGEELPEYYCQDNRL